MGNLFDAAKPKDAYGNDLEAECFVEPTTQHGREWGWKPAKLISIDPNSFSVQFDNWSTLTYDITAISFYGLRRVIVDKFGRNIKAQMKVKTSNGATGYVTMCNEKDAQFFFHGTIRLYRQPDIMKYGIVIDNVETKARACVGCT
uniref:Uncharacterized protein n=1 Tax=Pfiesteria piscicida TaxID=71001 RepID=A3E3R6_PFIPI|nr:unknown [Pfiesteria piscicida]